MVLIYRELLMRFVQRPLAEIPSVQRAFLQKLLNFGGMPWRPCGFGRHLWPSFPCKWGVFLHFALESDVGMHSLIAMIST